MASLPSTYKAAFVDKLAGPITIRDTPLKKPAEGELLIKVLACGVCGSDGFVHSHGLPNQKAYPIVLGHEMVGDVVAVGANVKHFKGGERVGGPWHGGHDQTCRTCERGFFQACDHEEVNGVSRDGGFAQYALLRAEATVQLPADCDPVETAPLLCAGVTVFNSLRKQHIEQGNVVAVQGLGALGHLAVQYASKMGYDVVAISSGSSKRAFATELGAVGYIDSSAENVAEVLQSKYGGAACIICTAPRPDSIGPFLWGIQPSGTLLVLAPLSGVTVDATPLVLRGIKMTGFPSGHAIDSQEAVAFAKTKNVKAMIEKYKFSDIQAAFDRLYSGKARFKVVVDMRE